MRRSNSEPRSEKGVAVCIIVENAASPGDARVWQEATALTEAGYRVSIICPKAAGFEEGYVVKDNIEIFRHASCEGSGPLGYLLEYSHALVAEFCLALRVYRRTRFQVIQACNPPDTIFLVALFFKVLFRVRFIFDQHDPAPELFEVRYQRRGALYWLLRAAERLTFRTADAVISTNEAIAEIATRRGRVEPDRVFVVRTCPDLKRFQLPSPLPSLKEGRKHLVIYLGLMGSQDGLDLLIQSIDCIVHAMGRRDTTFALLGSGPELPRVKLATSQMGLESYVKFTGMIRGNSLLEYLATADVGVAPDPVNPFNDLLTMLKIMEYMACGIPTVLYDLRQGRRTAGEAARYAKGNDPVDFAHQITALLDSDELRHELGNAGRRRVRTCLDWNTERLTLLDAYRTALGQQAGGPAPINRQQTQTEVAAKTATNSR